MLQGKIYFNMEKLKVVTAFFDSLRGDNDDTEYTEENIMAVLKELEVEQYEFIMDVPTRVINEILTEVTKGFAPRLDSNQEQEMLDFFEELGVQGKMELSIIAKSLRYLLRADATPKACLVVVDVQNDFISGSLALRNAPAGQEGEEVVEVINNIINSHNFDAVFYSYDWHPSDHCSYVTNVSLYPLHESSTVTAEDANILDKVVYDGEKVMEQIMWPVHCTQGSEGAELHPDLLVVDGAINIYKGQRPNVDSYSALWDNNRMHRSDMLGHLFDKNITHIFICGLATDFCVAMTSIDAVEHGFDVYVILDACRGVADATIEKMKEKMSKAGCQLIESQDIGEKLSNFA